MSGRGPAPKDPDKRRRRNADPVGTTALVEAEDVRGPDLPGGIEWPLPTLAWWETWRRSPQSQAFTQTDWDFMVDTALLHARFWAGDEKVAGELRLRVAKFGATIEDRQRLRMQIGDPKAGKSKSSKPDDDPYAGLRLS